jgi:tetratricopeptide (TPR) repeat protein
MMALLVLLWIKRKDKLVVLGILFFLVNLLLVMQVLTIGLTIVSERYTYVPYIGLAFLVAMLADRGIKTFPKKIFWVAAIVIAAVFGFITFRRTDTWKDSGTLWTDVINRYPNTTYPRTNRANYVSIQAGQQKTQAATDSLYRLALEDCNIALKINPNLAAGYEKRGLIYLGLGMLNEALADGEALVKRDPKNKIGYDVRGTVYFRYNQPEKALVNYDTCILLKPDDHRSYSNRGTIYLNYYQKYKEALQEYNKAISISPLGSYYLNRSICYYRMGDLAKARADADTAMQRGTAIPDNLKNALQIK